MNGRLFLTCCKNLLGNKGSFNPLVNFNNLIKQEEIDESKFVKVDDCYETTTLINKAVYNAYLDLKT